MPTPIVKKDSQKKGYSKSHELILTSEKPHPDEAFLWLFVAYHQCFLIYEFKKTLWECLSKIEQLYNRLID